MIIVWAISTLVVKELFRRKDFYVVFVLTALITLLLGSVSIFNDNQVVRYLKEVCLLLIWISLLVIATLTAARQLPAEREQRTIFPLLAKPVTRAQVIAGKFLGCWLAAGLALLTFYAFFIVIAGTREHLWPWASYAQALPLHWFMLAIVIAFALFGSILFAAPSSNATITLVLAVGVLLVGPHLNAVALGLAEPGRSILYTVYFLIPHLEFFDMREMLIHGWGAAPWGACGLAALYSAAYSGFLLWAAWLAYRNRPLS